MSRTKKIFFYAIAITLPVVYIILDIIGTITAYTPVPDSDMWLMKVDFYFQFVKGNFYSFFVPLCMQRAILVRILFWLDINFFGGVSILTIICIFLSIATIGIFLALFLKKNLNGDENKFQRRILTGVIFCLVFSWVTSTTYLWPLNIVRYFPILLAIISFYLMALAKERNSTFYFVLSLSTGSLAFLGATNGILVVPLLTIMAVYCRMSWKKIIPLLLAGIVGVLLYFHGLDSNNDMKLFDRLINNYYQIYKYTFFFLGAPIFYLSGYTGGHVAGFEPDLKFLFFVSNIPVIIIPVCLYALLKNIKNPKKAPFEVGLAFFLLFLLSTAFVIAIGRFDLGYLQAMRSRYTIVAFCAWSISLIFITIWLKNIWIKKPAIFALLALSIPIFFLPYQTLPLIITEKYEEYSTEHNMTGLATILAIHDKNCISAQENSVEVAQKAIKEVPNSFWYSLPEYKRAREIFNTIKQNQSSDIPYSTVNGRILNVMQVTSPQILRVKGWIEIDKNTPKPEIICFIDKNNKVSGVGLVLGKNYDITTSKNNIYFIVEGYAIANRKENIKSIVIPAKKFSF